MEHSEIDLDKIREIKDTLRAHLGDSAVEESQTVSSLFDREAYLSAVERLQESVIAFIPHYHDALDTIYRAMGDHIDKIAEEYISVKGPTVITEGEEASITVEGDFEISNIDWSLEPYPRPAPRQKQRILVIGASHISKSLAIFQAQAEALGIEVCHISAEAYKRTQLPRHTEFMEEVRSLARTMKVSSQIIDSYKPDYRWIDQAFSEGRVNAHSLKAQVAYKVHGSRRGRNIKTDESRKARYSQSRK